MTPAAAAGIIAALILVEGFFSGSESAVTSADPEVLRDRAERGSRGAELALRMLEQETFLLGTCLVGTNLAVVGGSTVATAFIATQYEEAGALGVGLVLSLAVLLFGELIPKSVYQGHANRITPVVIYPLYAASRVLWPLLAVLDRAVPESERRDRREELRILLDAPRHVRIDDEDRDLIRRVFKFSEAKVEEVMKPLIEVVMIDEEGSVRDAIRSMVEHGHSRLPTFRERVDRVTGFVQHDDLLFAGDLDQPVRALARRVPFVPELKRVEELIFEFRRDRSHMAIAVNEYGGAVGLITREDVLEEIVGEIDDEFDSGAQPVRKINERQWLVSARAEEETLASDTGFTLPEGDYETLAGFMLSRLGHVPRPGERLVEGEWSLEVARASDRAILEVRLTRRRRA